MLRMRFVGVFIVALALVLVFAGIASAQGDVTAVLQSSYPLAFNSRVNPGTGMGWIGYRQDSMGNKGWSGNFNFTNLPAGQTFTVKGGSGGATTICSFTTNGMGMGGCWMPSPWPTWTGIANPVNLDWDPATNAVTASCTVPPVGLYDSAGKLYLGSYSPPGVGRVCRASMWP